MEDSAFSSWPSSPVSPLPPRNSRANQRTEQSQNLPSVRSSTSLQSHRSSGVQATPSPSPISNVIQNQDLASAQDPPSDSTRTQESSPWTPASVQQTALSLPSLSSIFSTFDELPDIPEPDAYNRETSPSNFLLLRNQDIGSPSRPVSSRGRPTSPPCFISRRDSLFDLSPSPDAAMSRSLQARSNSIVDLTDSPPTMAPKARPPTLPSTTTSSKRRRASSSASQSPVKKQNIEKAENIEEVNLLEVDDDQDYAAYVKEQQAKAAKQRQQDEVNKPVKLSEFQCIICLDAPSDLTVTWCGHLFCSQCLFEALHAGTGKKVCPICRQTISTTPSKSRGSKNSKGVFPLAMKLMTAKRQGKQADRGAA